MDHGSIPACAGEPRRLPRPGRRPAVYPRVCGGTGCAFEHVYNSLGLSPRVRGNRGVGAGGVADGRSIPACAGEPLATPETRLEFEVYPRVCGGTGMSGHPGRRLLGLSPRVRGNRPTSPRRAARPGSIPACAGEPRPGPAAAALGWVYPRVCGGTGAATMVDLLRRGLSPRVRGNHLLSGQIDYNTGSIPACAGEPHLCHQGNLEAPVYPRVCGGTIELGSAILNDVGLSPRVRGNRPTSPRRAARPGSIPACAGEPRPGPAAAALGWVYPRVCGGTGAATMVDLLRRGLSPRVRGNHLLSGQIDYNTGSIPACAGEPHLCHQGNLEAPVYPRVCGGTIELGSAILNDVGLSPRVRGNLEAKPEALKHQRSIPACAGEPDSRDSRNSRGWVYPRVCGGTAWQRRIPARQ